MQQEQAYHFDNLDVVDDAGNVIAYTVSKNLLKAMKQLLRGNNITNLSDT